jgi:3-oxoadipate enol-lactonase
MSPCALQIEVFQGGFFMQTERILVGANHLAVNTFGDRANPPLFLIHGIKQIKEVMSSFAEILQDRFFVVAYDCLGHGKSDKPKTLTLADQGDALLGLIKAMGFKDAFVIGESMGSYVAQQAAIIDQAPIRKLILLVTKADGKTSSVSEYLKRQGIDGSKVPSEELLKAVAGALWSPNTPKSVIESAEKVSSNQEPMSEEYNALIDKSCAGFDFRPDLPNIKIPTLVIAGQYDGLNPPSYGKAVADLIPKAKFIEIKDAGHMLRLEHPREVAKIVEEFFLGA